MNRGMDQDRIIDINVGGEKISMSVSSLCSVEDSYLEYFFRDPEYLPKDKDGLIYLDRDPKYMHALMNYVANDGHVRDAKNDFDRYMFNEELKFWNIGSKSKFRQPLQSNDGRLMTFKTFTPKQSSPPKR